MMQTIGHEAPKSIGLWKTAYCLDGRIVRIAADKGHLVSLNIVIPVIVGRCPIGIVTVIDEAWVIQYHVLRRLEVYVVFVIARSTLKERLELEPSGHCTPPPTSRAGGAC